MNILHIAARELRSLFLSPLAWAVLAVMSFILSWLFLVQLDLFIEIQPRIASIEGAPGITAIVVAPLADSAAFILLIFIPLLSMRLISDERRQRTLPLLLSSPVSMMDIALGKYLGLLGFLGVLLLLFAMMPLSLLLGGTLDFGLFAACLLGLALIMATFAAIGLLVSSLTAQPIIAAIVTLLVLILLWILDWNTGNQSEQVNNLFTYLSLREHYSALLKGVFNSSDVVYFLLLISGCLVLTIRRLDNFRLQH